MTLLPADLLARAKLTLDKLRERNMTFAAAESCTGGLVCAALTSLAGSSSVVRGGFVTYANEAKTAMLGVPPELIARDGAVSENVARAMASGVLTHSDADIAVAVTGIAGPGGGSPEKPVGLVHFAAGSRGKTIIHRHALFEGDRDDVRRQAAIMALELALIVAEA